MTFDNIKNKIRKICINLFKDRNIDIDIIDYVDFVADYAIDSITFISLVIEIEEVFSIIIPENLLLMENMNSIDKITQIVFNEVLTMSDTPKGEENE